MRDNFVSNEESFHKCPFPADPRKHGLSQQVKHLSAFTAYFKFPEGDVPVSIVASSIKEAAKLASMPGVISPEASEPIQIKNEGRSVGVAMPVQMISFNTVIVPEEAKTAGAIATPGNFEVRNGENVIFEVKTPFGYEFEGWYKTGSETRLSDKERAEIDVFDNFVTRIQYEARFVHRPTFRSGRYLDLTRGNLISFEFPSAIPTKAPYGKAVWDGGTVASYFTEIDELTLPAVGEDGIVEDGTIVFHKDPTITQPGTFSMKGTFKFSPVGINILVDTVPLDNPYGYVRGSVITLQYLNDL